MERNAQSAAGKDNAPRNEGISLDAPPIPNNGDELEEEDTQEDGIPTLRRDTSRRLKVPINYQGMMGKEHVKSQDYAFLETVDPYDTHSFSLSSVSSSYTRDTFMSNGGTVEDLHLCAFIAKVQTHDLDNPTYDDNLRGAVAEKTAWDDSMTQELKSLADLRSFEMVARPRGANIFQSTWDFKRKRYPDGTIKK